MFECVFFCETKFCFILYSEIDITSVEKAFMLSYILVFLKVFDIIVSRIRKVNLYSKSPAKVLLRNLTSQAHPIIAAPESASSEA